MTTKANTWFSVGVLLAAATLIIFAVLTVRSCTGQHNTVTTTDAALRHKEDTLQRHLDGAGREHGTKALVTGSQDAILIAYRREIDSLAHSLGIRDKQLQEFSLLGTSTGGTVSLKVDTVYSDNTANYQFHYDDHWLHLNGNIGPGSSLNYQLQDSLVVSTYWKRRWLMGRKTTYTDVYSLNPSVHVTGLTTAQIVAREPGRFSLGPYIGWGYSGNTLQPSIGISLQYALIRF